MRHGTGVVGAVILAASKPHFTSIMEATKALTQIEKEVYPKKELSESYNIRSWRFILHRLNRLTQLKK